MEHTIEQIQNAGAKPPSSPTAVLNPRSCNTFFKAWKTSAPIRRPSRKEGAPTGIIRNNASGNKDVFTMFFKDI